MSKFNEKVDNKIDNYMGGVSFKHTPKEELVFAVLTSFIETSYYESKNERVDRITKLVKDIAKTDPTFVAKLAIYTRTIFNMRSSSHVLFGELARNHRGDNLVSRALAKGIVRVDDATEIMSYLKKPIPNQIKKGIAKALNKFNAYQLAKYKSEGKAFSLVDALNLAHPKPEDKNKEAWQKLMKGELKSTDTWEARLSSGEDKTEVWKDMLEKGTLNYMALLRNLRNIIKDGDDNTIGLAAKKIADEQEVLRSKQLPFRFLSAYAELGKYKKNKTGDWAERKMIFEKEIEKAEGKDKHIELIINALEQALKHSIQNIPLLKGKTVILSDNSGSMRGDGGGGSPISAMSSRKTSDIANLFAVLYWTRAENTIVGLFGDNLIVPRLDRSKSIFENYDLIEQEADKCGGATETGVFTAISQLIEDKEEVDRIVIFSDCQVGEGCRWYDSSGTKHGSDFNKLFQKYNTMFPNVITYAVDLKGYGNYLLEGRVHRLAGWSNEIFNIMNLLEQDRGALIKSIEEIEL